MMEPDEDQITGSEPLAYVADAHVDDEGES